MPDPIQTPATPTSQSEAAPAASAVAVPAAAAPAVAEPVVEPAASAPAAAAPEAIEDGTVLGGKEEAPKEAPADPPEAAATAPEKYELAMEGVTLDPELVTEAEPVLRELGLSNDQANTLVPMAQKIMEKAQNGLIQQLTDAGAQQKKDWLDAFHADPEIGGGKKEETEHLAAKGLDALGFAADHPFRKALNETGFGNHPDMIRAFRRIGEMASEDGFVRPDGAAKVEVPTEQRWYKGA